MRKNITVLTGAGISAESGLKTFRDADGLWEGYDINEVATIDAWHKNPGLVLQFYNMRRNQMLKAEPNQAHKSLAELEQIATVTVITQNVDDLHERGGSKKIIHLHGSLLEVKPENDDSLILPYDKDLSLGDLSEKGSQLRPNIVWFGEAVPMMEMAINEIYKSDILIIIGTSMVVYPAASLVDYLPYDSPIYLCDRSIPFIRTSNPLHIFEESASTGVPKIVNQLKSLL